ncbi:copper-exporting P-type ATPase A [Sporocytophaga myxococcoides]|uniref:Copper-exporting P-type ATPase A n=1 Tax=Sporocytophaga myxococcoides TaxID=153721 RepID=A0A098LJ91_9BACT|nr:heavy metal translocating P-type ATPase [Sporocytophaga myxococcoides]GAL86534.1 copper-exporting P-type ATPase A [Sporocytophaga myxococcoides]
MSTIKKIFPVEGLSCASCAVSVESILKSIPEVKDVNVNYAGSTAQVTYENSYPAVKLKEAVQSVGYDLILEEEEKTSPEADQSAHFKKLKMNAFLSLAFATPVVVIGMFFHMAPYANQIMLLLSAPVILIFGKQFFVNAFRLLKHGQTNMDTLVALSTGIAFAFSTFNTLFPEVLLKQGVHPDVYFEAAAVVIAFILLGRMLEERAKQKTGSAIKKLMGLQPKTVKVIRGGAEVELKIEEVMKWDEIVIRSGEKIPVDGLVTSGNSFVDESTITGESIPSEKIIGAKVYAGTLNQKGSFTMKAEKVGSETLLAGIIKTVQEAQGSKAPVQKLADKVAGIFVPIVIGIAVLTFIVWFIVGKGENSLTHALLAMITVLVIACPCALGLATPTAIMVGIGKGAEKGILIRDAESLELAKKTQVLVLDKTGTITMGKPRVTDVYWMENLDNKPLLEGVLLTAERKSGHPLAEAVVQYYKERNVNEVPLDDFESQTGKGVKVQYKGSTYYIGSRNFVKNDIQVELSAEMDRMSNQYSSEAKTLIYLAHNKNVLALIAVADEVKQGSYEAIQKIKDLGIDIYMLTGDTVQTAEAIAKKTGIENYKAEVMPSDKANFVNELKKQGKVVAMAGDGVNDAEALAFADVSIAMAQGSDIAMDVAKITLMSSDLRLIPESFKLSKFTVNTIRQNLFWAFIYNLIGIPLAAGVLYPVNGFLLSPMLAGLAMALSSVSVVMNSLRLKTVRL